MIKGRVELGAIYYNNRKGQDRYCSQTDWIKPDNSAIAF